jgi:hypothetical protein
VPFLVPQKRKKPRAANNTGLQPAARRMVNSFLPRGGIASFNQLQRLGYLTPCVFFTFGGKGQLVLAVHLGVLAGPPTTHGNSRFGALVFGVMFGLGSGFLRFSRARAGGSTATYGVRVRASF